MWSWTGTFILRLLETTQFYHAVWCASFSLKFFFSPENEICPLGGHLYIKLSLSRFMLTPFFSLLLKYNVLIDYPDNYDPILMM